MGARALDVREYAEDRRKKGLVSWCPDSDAFSSLCLDALREALEVFLDPNDVVVRDPSRQAGGEPSAEDRVLPAEATDFVVLMTNKYLLDAKQRCATEDPEIVTFIRHRLASGDKRLGMWLFPLLNLPLDRVAVFKDKGIRTLDFPWWHGKQPIKLFAKDDPRSKQEFKDEVTRRAGDIADVEHPERCDICGS